MKKFIIAGVAAATLAGGAFAFAANLTVSSQNLGSGSSAVNNPCTQIDTQYHTTYSNTAHTYYVTSIDLNKTSAGGVHGCTTEFFKVSVDLGGGSSKSYSGQLSAGQATVTPSATDLDANAVVQITAVATDQQQS